MIKRMNKVTSLLVAAAAIVSLVPATGVNAADRLANKEGNITGAYAFDGGKYIYEGYKTDDDESGVYFNAGDKDKSLENIDTLVGRYGSKYAEVKDGSDEYLVDLSTGKTLDEDRSDIEATLNTKLRSTLKKTERYENLKTNSTLELKGEVVSNSFADTWFKYEATTEGAADIKTTIFTNKDGKYIDASYLANMTVVKNDNEVVKVEKFGKDKDGVTVDLVAMDAIAQDKDSIYTMADVRITTAGGATVKTYIQKISKAQGEKEKDAYLPKKVESFDITTKFDSSDIKDAQDVFERYVQADSKVNFKVINGVLYATEFDGKEVKVTTIKLKKSKVATVTGSKKLDVYVAEQDVEEKEDAVAVSYDVDGNTWVLNKGTIYKFDGKDYKKMYTCDRSLNTLNVYNEGSLVAWDSEGDVYTTVQEGKAESDKEVTPAQTGWVNTAAGWTFYDAAGKQVVGSWVNAGGVWYMVKADGIMATGWYNDNGTWYFLNASGAMQTGWMNANGTWYYLQSSGAMKTGWLNDNGTWYYLNANGSMAANTTVDGYKLAGNGAWIR